MQSDVGEKEGTTMAEWTNGKSVEDTRAEREAAVAMAVAWLMGVARTFRIDPVRKVGLDQEIRTAQVDLIRAILLACADGLTAEDLRARFIDPVLRHADASDGGPALLAETVRLVEQRLTRTSGA
jgi:hypothetical protein